MAWIQPLLLTLQLMAVAVIIASVLGIVGAWAASSLDTRRWTGRVIQRFFLASMIAAIAMPMILHAAAWEATAGKFGWMILTQTGSRTSGSDTYGFFAGLVACGWIHGVVGAAIVSLATWVGVQRIPAALAWQSRLDVGPFAAWWRVRLPIAAPWLISSLLATALLAATEMTVVDLYGYRTIADEFYLFYAADPSMTSVWMTCAVPLAIASILLTWLTVSRRRLLAIQSEPRDTTPPEGDFERLGERWRWLPASLAVLVACLIVVVPVSGLLIKVGHEVSVEEDLVQASWSINACVSRLLQAPRTFAHEYQWTAIIAVVTGGVALLVAWPIAALARLNRNLEPWIDSATILLVTVPGPIVGLAIVTLFQAEIPGFRQLYRSTLFPTILALMVRAVPIAYWILRAGYRQIATPVLESAKMDGPWLRRFWLIDRPLLKGKLSAAALAAAIFASGDVPATLPVVPPGVTTVGTRLFGLLHSGARYQEAALALGYVAAVVAIALLFIRHTFSSRVRL